jgi:translation initiation factor IF-3
MFVFFFEFKTDVDSEKVFHEKYPLKDALKIALDSGLELIQVSEKDGICKIFDIIPLLNAKIKVNSKIIKYIVSRKDD